ncbi:flagellar hook protein FlgE [Hippea maritima]|uniref:Flagellar hook protein FlgE n=1 Tax=Hippea maritima (strain ATCC 700847 / DSM 10411 / MH2) TaxID=760142 RepID=F2LTI0_HIPMA|nr:flagellar hook protein FlgE [Hippea maritima]AEA33305.1 flagellar hook-basal body protein [Hippea maritima DSM 10411]
MLRSLWSGVSGLKSEQQGMDVVGNNVANVNTIGFKKGRINFVDVLSQTMSAATGPEGNIGGKNAAQIGLGTTVAVVDNIFSQGSLQATSKITDLAIQGDGFFVVSDDGGKTYRYTRAGDFSFDADGNLVNPEGFIVQGWLANEETHKINTAASIENIVVPQDKTVPAGITKNISIKANLNGGDTIEEMAPAHGTVDENNNTVEPDDMSVLFDVNGEAINLGKTIATFANNSTSFSSLYDINGNQIQLSSGATISLDITYGGTTATATVSYPSDFNTLGSLASALGNAVSAAIGTRVASFTITPDGEIQMKNLASSDITVANIATTNDLNSYLKHGLINLEGGEGRSATIEAGKTRTTLPFLSAKGDVLAMSFDGGANYDAYRYVQSDTGTANNDFHTIEDLRAEINNDIVNGGNGEAWATSSTSSDWVTIDPTSGEIVIKNNSTDDHVIGAVYSNNLKFATIMGTLSGLVGNGSEVTSQPFEAAVHVTSIDVYDSLGNKHTVTFTFRKKSFDPITNYTTWSWQASVPEPGEVSNDNGEIQFDQTGKLVYLSSPLAITVDWRNGTASQVINLDFGDIDSFDGLTQFSLPSQTTAQTQDGYPGGSLQRIMINQDGVVVGIFSNGKSYPLAQIAMAKFANNEGLMKEGGSMYSETANSGAPLIGTAGTGGRGTFAPSHLEMSNVDLAEEFTNMIIYERAFQANSRSITTSDQMIQELLNLKR